MKIGIVIGTNEAEVVWNAFRFGVTSLKANHEAKIFLINKGVEIEDIKNEKYNVKEQTDLFIENKGKILVCGTCLKSRQKEGSNVCPISTMKDLLELVEESDKFLTFG
ncbi:MAG: DsrE family protein [Candidatus Aenigmarchaeota archaeon]|nr:DsrE family protein [Candidatus Aenigmarchaeota archaeon]